ncbi:MAG: sel1 repeat family protein [Legionella sp.]|nr:sel1 repeat family protein [Legionella sp.]
MRFFVYVLFFCLTACSLNALNLREGVYDFKKQNYRSAFVRLMPEAEKGNCDAQYAVGYMYYYGEGVTEDKKKAKKWITRAAEAGQKDAITAAKLLREEAKHPY